MRGGLAVAFFQVQYLVSCLHSDEVRPRRECLAHLQNLGGDVFVSGGVAGK